jgi:hypothetical protein
MYTTLLGSALLRRDQSAGPPTIGQMVAELLRSRVQLTASGVVSSPSQAKTVDDVASQLAYDLALISLVRGLGIGYVVDRFDDGERHLLEQTLIGRGIPLDAIDGRP